MALILLSGPLIEPISLTEAKAHLRVDGSAEDTLISSLVTTSRLHIEAALSCALITQSWTYLLDAWPGDGKVTLPLYPIQSIDLVHVYDDDDGVTVIAPEDYLLDGAGTPPRLVRRNLASWPRPGRSANGIEIGFTAGYGATASDVPEPVRQALHLLVAHWYEYREPAGCENGSIRIPPTISSLLSPYTAKRL